MSNKYNCMSLRLTPIQYQTLKLSSGVTGYSIADLIRMAINEKYVHKSVDIRYQHGIIQNMDQRHG